MRIGLRVWGRCCAVALLSVVPKQNVAPPLFNFPNWYSGACVLVYASLVGPNVVPFSLQSFKVLLQWKFGHGIPVPVYWFTRLVSMLYPFRAKVILSNALSTVFFGCVLWIRILTLFSL